MAYGTVKVDTIIFDQGGTDQNVTTSGIYRAITSGVTVTGTISGAVLIGTTTVSGATVTGTAVQGTTVQGVSGTFTSLTGTTTTGTTANFVSGVFTTRISGTTVTGDTGQFTSGTFVSLTGTTITGTTINAVTVSSTTGTFGSITGTTITGTTINGATVNSTTGNFTSLTGVTVTGTTAQFASGVFITQVSGLTVTGTQSSFTSGNFVTLSGATATFTSGIIASGTAAAPSLAILGDPDTGVFSPGADQLAVATNGTGRLFVDSAGDVGIGTTSPVERLDIANGVMRFGNTTAPTNESDGAAYFGKITGGGAISHSSFIALRTNSVERARIDSSGRLLVGTSSASQSFDGGTTIGAQIEHTGSSNKNLLRLVSNAAANWSPVLSFARSRGTTNGAVTAVASDDNLGSLSWAGADGTGHVLAAQILASVDGTPGANDMPGRLVFSTTADGASSPTERMKIDSTGRITGSTGGLEITRTVDSAAALGSFISSSATTGNQYGLYVRLDGDPNNTGQYFLECYGGVGNRRATIRSNGGLANYQSNNVDLSDQRTKRNIVPASSSWDCVQALEVVNFNYLDDDAGEAPRVGVIAQQVQQHCPEVVIPYQEAEDAVFDEDGNVVTPAMEERLGVREQQIMWMAIKALQEAQVRIEVLEAEVAALRAQ